MPHATIDTRRQRRARRGERGVAMFVVMMLLMMVSAAGVFVTRSSSMEIRSSGYVRQSAQTHYVAETGASSVMTRLRTACAAYFNSNMRVQALTPNALPGCPMILTSRGQITPPCYTFYLPDFDVITTPQTLFTNATGTGTSRSAGSFGGGGLGPRFQVRVTELGADTSPQRGADVSDPSLTVLPVRLLVESEGTTELDATLYGTDTTNAARGTETLRAITVIPCN
ncbi:MAG: hypothetical protein JWM10_547 [Myxococcaceae bacterium]|nr:hypothetical protein [Myxococcaceae bacterium]